MSESELNSEAESPVPATRETLHQAGRLLRSCWAPLALTDIVYKVLAFVVLTPILAMAFRLFVELSGRPALADQDIMYFFLSPMGWLCFVVVGGLWLAILALEQAALFHVLRQRTSRSRLGAVDSIKFALAQFSPVIRLTARLSCYTLIAAVPFLALAGAVYLSLLNEFDINYYLAERPPEFLWAVTCGVLIVIAMACTLLSLFARWMYAFPLVIFEGLSTSESLRECRVLSQGHRVRLIVWLAGWAFAMSALSTLVTGAIGVGARWAVPAAASSLPWLLLAIGTAVILWTLTGVGLNLLTSTSFAVLLFTLYGALGRLGSESEPADLPVNAPLLNLTWKRLLIGGTAGALLSLAVGAVLLQTTPVKDSTEVTAHRGASTLAPENSLASARAAIEVGADWVEIDVQETADGHVVVYHDADFKRLAGNELKIWDATLSDLADIDIGSSFDREFKDERVPTFEQILQTCKGKAGVAIELKYYGHEVELEKRVIEIIEKHGMESDVVIMSLKREAVEKIKKMNPKLRVGQLAAAAIGSLQRVDADFLAINASMASRDFIQKTQAGGREVHVWTVNDAVTMSMMIGRGVDNLITDNPALARKVLEHRAELGVTERGLLGIAELLGVQLQIASQ